MTIRVGNYQGKYKYMYYDLEYVYSPFDLCSIKDKYAQETIEKRSIEL